MTREELEEQAERYLGALAGHDLASLPAAPGLRFTENGRELQLGEGLGAAAAGVGYWQVVVDREGLLWLTNPAA